MRAGPAARYVLSPVPLSPSHLRPRPSLPVPRLAATLPVLKRSLSACPPSENKRHEDPAARPPLPIPGAQPVPARVTGERGEKQLQPLYPASATTVISWNKARMRAHVSARAVPLTLRPLSSALPPPAPVALLAIRPQSRRHATRVFIISLISQRSDLFAPLSAQSVLRV